MKCGICGKDTMLYPNGQSLRMLDSYDLARHKKQEHPTEYLTAIKASRDKAQATKAAKADEAKRRHDARLAAGRPVIRKDSKGPRVASSAGVDRYDLNGHHPAPRFPEPTAWAGYEREMATIAAHQRTADGWLADAWEGGTPVTAADLEALDKAEEAEETP